MLKRILLAAVGAVAFVGTAGAADMPKGPVYKAPPPVFNWSGCYVGGQIGGAWGDASYNDLGAGTTASYDVSGILGGAHIGCNRQVGNIVYGIQGDFNFGNIDGNDGGAGGVTDTTTLRWNASLVGRLGVAQGRTLFYGLGGVAFANIEHMRTGAVVESPDQTYTGWTVGLGIEHALSPRWTARVEYRYTDYGTERFTYTAFTSPVDVEVQTHSVQLGVSYRW